MKNKTKFTAADILNSPVGHLNQHLLDLPKEEKIKQNKYRNTPTEVNGIKFPSKREAKRYKILLLRLKAGDIAFLRLQVHYELNPGGAFSYEYIADFVYTEVATMTEVVEDAKGTLTREYKKKRRLMKKIHNIIIKET